MKHWNIDMIQALSEDEARALAIEALKIKGHAVYLVDFGEYFGYSALVFMDGRHIYYANEYELHYRYGDPTREQLRAKYIRYLGRKLFTEDEIAGPIADYDDYRRRNDFLHNYYGMRREYVSIFAINPSKEEREAYERRTATMTYDPVCFAWFDDPAFVERHVELHVALEAAWDERQNDYEVIKEAFIREMYNHEYSINYQGDWDTLSAFGNIAYYRGEPEDELRSYFDQLMFTDTQRRAYLDARKEYYRQINEVPC